MTLICVWSRYFMHKVAGHNYIGRDHIVTARFVHKVGHNYIGRDHIVTARFVHKVGHKFTIAIEWTLFLAVLLIMLAMSVPVLLRLSAPLNPKFAPLNAKVRALRRRSVVTGTPAVPSLALVPMSSTDEIFDRVADGADGARLRVGDVVEGRRYNMFKGESVWCRGTISAVTELACTVKYDDGTDAEGVPPDQLRRVPKAATADAAGSDALGPTPSVAMRAKARVEGLLLGLLASVGVNRPAQPPQIEAASSEWISAAPEAAQAAGAGGAEAGAAVNDGAGVGRPASPTRRRAARLIDIDSVGAEGAAHAQPPGADANPGAPCSRGAGRRSSGSGGGGSSSSSSSSDFDADFELRTAEDFLSASRRRLDLRKEAGIGTAHDLASSVRALGETTSCDLCFALVPTSDLAEHAARCAYSQATCGCCGMVVERFELGHHRRTCAAGLAVATECSLIVPKTGECTVHRAVAACIRSARRRLNRDSVGIKVLDDCEATVGRAGVVDDDDEADEADEANSTVRIAMSQQSETAVELELVFSDVGVFVVHPSIGGEPIPGGAVDLYVGADVADSGMSCIVRDRRERTRVRHFQELLSSQQAL